jgi:hypothetical protein
MNTAATGSGCGNKEFRAAILYFHHFHIDISPEQPDKIGHAKTHTLGAVR